MVNINKLKGKIVERGLTVEKLADTLGMDKSTLYRKINSSGDSISIKEADAIARALRLSLDDVNGIFFSQYVA